MPAVPLLDTHSVDVDLLVEVVEKRNGLYDHDVDLVGRELHLKPTENEHSAKPVDLESIPRQRVGETETHGRQILGVEAIEKSSKLASNAVVKIGQVVGLDLDSKLLAD